MSKNKTALYFNKTTLGNTNMQPDRSEQCPGNTHMQPDYSEQCPGITHTQPDYSEQSLGNTHPYTFLKPLHTHIHARTMQHYYATILTHKRYFTVLSTKHQISKSHIIDMFGYWSTLNSTSKLMCLFLYLSHTHTEWYIFHLTLSCISCFSCIATRLFPTYKHFSNCTLLQSKQLAKPE